MIRKMLYNNQVKNILERIGYAKAQRKERGAGSSTSIPKSKWLEGAKS